MERRTAKTCIAMKDTASSPAALHTTVAACDMALDGGWGGGGGGGGGERILEGEREGGEEEGEGGGETECKSDGGKEGDGVRRVRPVCQVHELPSSSRKISVQK